MYPDSKVHGANMGPIWGRQDPGGPHVGPMDLAIWVDGQKYATIINMFVHMISLLNKVVHNVHSTFVTWIQYWKY